MTTYREVFAVPAFRVIFISRSLAIGANTLRIVALSLLVFTITGSTLLSAVTFGIGFLPQVFGGLLLGSLADRLRPRPLITTGYLLEFAAALVLALVDMPIAASLVLVAGIAVFAPVFNGASSRLIAEVLTGDLYVLGRSLSSVAAGAAQILGMAFGGLAVAAVGPQRALLFSALCQLIAALIIRFGLADFPCSEHTSQASAVRQSWSTNVLLLGAGGIRRLLLIQWLPAALFVGGEGLIVAYAAHRGFPTSAAGFMLAAAPLGMLCGDLVVGRFVRPTVRTRLVTPLIATLGVPLIALAFNPPLALTVVALVIGGAGFAYLLGLQQAFLDAVPVATRGQAFALLSTGLMTFQGLGPLILGGIGQATGVNLALALAGVGTLAAAAIWQATGKPA